MMLPVSLFTVGVVASVIAAGLGALWLLWLLVGEWRSGRLW